MSCDLTFVPGEQNSFSIGEVFVERRPTDAGSLGDVRHCYSAQPILSDKLSGGVKDRIVYCTTVGFNRLIPELRHGWSIRRVLNKSSCLF
jgi:hypothetical protein